MTKVLARLWSGWKRVARAIGRANTIVLLTVFYSLILSPFGAMMRLFGWNPLESGKAAKRRSTNWKPVSDGSPDLESLRRQS